MNDTFTRDSVSVMLDKLSGNTFLGLTTETDVKLKGGKSNPLQGLVTKVTVSSVQIFTNQNGSAYAAKVQRRHDTAGTGKTFELSPRSWGERITGTPFVTHKGEDYLEVIFNKVISTEYFICGYPVAKEHIDGLPDSKPEAHQGGLDEEDKVILRTYKLSSLREIRAFGNEFKAA